MNAPLAALFRRRKIGRGLVDGAADDRRKALAVAAQGASMAGQRRRIARSTPWPGFT